MFFKQKTAYEMRISDWSSDVCSSDLGALHAVRNVEERIEEVRQEDQRADLVARRVGDQHDLAVTRGGELLVGRRDEVEQVAELAAGEIGRASCRERVCQSE